MKRLICILVLVLSGCHTETYLKCFDGAGKVVYEGVVSGPLHSGTWGSGGRLVWTSGQRKVWICDAAIIDERDGAHE